MCSHAINTESGLDSLQPQAAAADAAELWALVPVKDLSKAKQRLKECLGPQREGFTLAMFRDVLAALEDSQTVKRVLVVTPDACIAEMSRQRGIMVVEESGAVGMNAAIDQAVARVRSEAGRPLVILPADLPLLTGREIDRLANTFLNQPRGIAEDAIGISPSASRDGTNCLFLNTGRPFTFRYGHGSYALHKNGAAAQHRCVVSLFSRAVSLDIDEPRDIGEFLSFCRRHPQFKATETWKFLEKCDRLGQVELNLEV